MQKEIFFSLLLLPVGLSAQTSEVVSIGAGYTQQVWYDLETGSEVTRSADEWDIAFEIQGFEASILANTQKAGLVLYEAPYTVADWAALDTVGISGWVRLQNSPESWSQGAFNQGLTSDSLDLGWGNYNFITHIVTGDSLYVISLANGDFKKLRIDALAGGQYLFTYADIDGSNEVSGVVDKMNYMDKNFAYYSIENDTEIDREPLNSEWDLTFVRYLDFAPTLYGVTGVLVNKWGRSAEVSGVPVGSADWMAASFNSDMNNIGYDWKSFNMTTFQWEIQDSLTFFVETPEGNVWEVVFTDFGGASTGEFFFDYQQVSATSVAEISEDGFLLYPNPSNGIVNVQLEDEWSSAVVQVVDATGKLLATSIDGANTQLRELDLGGIPNGVYFLRAISGDKVLTEQLLLQR